MGQYFIVYNITRSEAATPGFGSWKMGTFDINEIISILGWLLEDQIYALGDYGTIINFSAKNPSASIKKDDFKIRYIWDGKEVSEEIDIQEVGKSIFESARQERISDLKLAYRAYRAKMPQKKDKIIIA